MSGYDIAVVWRRDSLFPREKSARWGRKISQEDILYIRTLIEQHPHESRRTLSTKLCEAWQWRQANGALRDMVSAACCSCWSVPARSSCRQ
jgi:hypothetical protein